MQHETMTAAAATEARACATLNAAEFANAAKLLASKVIERRNQFPVLSAVLIEVQPCGRVILTGTDLDIMAHIELAADAGETIEPGRLCLDAGPLSDTLAKARKDSDRVRLIQTESDRATLKAGRGVWALRGHAAEDFPLTATPEAPDMAAPIPAGQFLADLKALAPAVSTEETRYYLNGYAMQARQLAGRERFVMVATDGGNMAAASRPMPEGLAGWDDAILPRKTGALILAAAKAYDAGESVTLSRFGNVSAGKVGFAFGPVLIVSKLIDGTFPQWNLALEDMAAPTEGTEPALFPDMIPGRPLAEMEALQKAAPVAIEWQDGPGGYLGCAPGDPGLAWAVMSRVNGNQPRNGYFYETTGDGPAHTYLASLAEMQGLPSADDMEALCAPMLEAFRTGEYPVGGRPYVNLQSGLVRHGGRIVGLTVAAVVKRNAHYVTVQDWEALCERQVEVPETQEPVEGSYSVLMPADGPQPESVYTVTVEGDRTYPVAVNSGGKIHLSKEQVAALCGDDLWQVIEFAGPDGKPRYVSAWCYEQGDSRLLCVGKDGRTPKAGAVREYFNREQVAAALAGEAIAAEAPVIEAAGPTVEACEAASAPETALACDAEPAPATHAAPMPEIVPIPAPLAAEAASDADACPIAAIRARLAEVEAMLAALPAQSARPKRTAAHDRAIRRAWAERKARREAEKHLRIGTGQYEQLRAQYENAAEARTTFLRGMNEAAERERQADDRARLAEQEAAEALTMREEMRGMLTAAERRAEAAEAENAELWAEIEALTAPATPVGAIAAEAGAA